jgi:hypothetical protein
MVVLNVPSVSSSILSSIGWFNVSESGIVDITPTNPTAPKPIRGLISISFEIEIIKGHNMLPTVPAAEIIDIAYDRTGVGNISDIYV